MQGFEKLKGLVAAVFTPYENSGNINPQVVEPYAQRLKSQNVAGVFVNGSSGEGVMLSVEERKILAEKWIACAEGRFKVIVHVGSTSIEISKELAAHAMKAGADSIASMAPNFIPSSDVKIIAEVCKEIASAAPALPFYYYHLPVATGSNIKVNKLFAEVDGAVSNFAGVKFTFTDFMDMHQCIIYKNGRYDVLHGHDEILINGLVLGVKGAIGTTFNFMPAVYQRIMQAYADQDIDTALHFQRRAIQVIEIMLKYNNAIVGGKAIMKLSGIDCGGCRLPLKNLTPAEFGKLEQELNEVGFSELVNMEAEKAA